MPVVVEALAVLLVHLLHVLAVPEVVAPGSAILCSRVRKCWQHTQQALCLLALALAVLLARASQVLAPRAETLEGRAVTLRSGLLPQRMAAAVPLVVAVLPLPAGAVLEAASGQRVQITVLWERTARAVVVWVARQQA